MDFIESSEWQKLMGIMNGYVMSDVLYAASELDLFTVLESLASPDLDAITAALGIPRHSTRVLLLASAACGLIQRDTVTGIYRNSEVARKALLSSTRNSLRPFIRFNHNIQQICSFRLLDSLKSGSNKGIGALPGTSQSLYDRLSEIEFGQNLFQEGMAAYTLFGPRMIEFPELRDRRSLLDVGGGVGLVAEQLVSSNPDLKVLILEKPSVCRIREKDIDQNKIQFVPGDLFQDTWPREIDSILFSHLLEIFSEDKVNMLYSKAASALPVGGKIFVWTLVCDDDETSSLQAAKSSTYFLGTASGEGMAYPAKFHLQSLEEAGFTIEKVYRQSEFDHCGIVAERRGTK